MMNYKTIEEYIGAMKSKGYIVSSDVQPGTDFTKMPLEYIKFMQSVIDTNNRQQQFLNEYKNLHPDWEQKLMEAKSNEVI